MRVTTAMDAALVERYRAGDRSAFDEIYRRYQRPVYRLMARLTHTADDAEDMTQEAFVHVLKGLPRFQGRSDLYTWIYRIAKNQCLQYLKRN